LSRVDAFSERAIEIIKLLLLNGARVDARDTKCATPLHQAAFRGNADAVDLLLKAEGSEVALWAETQGHYLPLHNASDKGHDTACRYLVDAMLWTLRESHRSNDNAERLTNGTWPHPTRMNAHGTALLERTVQEHCSMLASIATLDDEEG